MAVDEPQAGVPRKGSEDPQEERAVAAEHDRALPRVEKLANARSDRRRGATHLTGPDHTGQRIAASVADAGGGDSPGVARAQPLDQARGACWWNRTISARSATSMHSSAPWAPSR